MRIEEVEGIGPIHGAKLTAAGVATTEALLEQGASAGGRRRLAEATGISETAILEWVNHCDLMRLDGVGSEYSDLLEAAGVDSPAELAQRNAANLAITLQEVVAARPGIVRRIPSEAEVAGWIAQAGSMAKVVTHGGGGGTGSESPAGGAALGAETAGAAAATTGSTETPAGGPVSGAGSGATSPASTAAPGATRDEGWWARIKRLFGGG